MTKKTTLTDAINGVSVVITDKNDGSKPDVTAVNDAVKCGLTIPPDSDLYKELVALANGLDKAAVEGEPMLSYRQIEGRVSVNKAGPFAVTSVDSNTKSGTIPGDFSKFAASLKKQCPTR